MKLLKRITAVMAALLIAVNISINSFAEAAPVPFVPNITVVSGGGNAPTTSFLGELLLGAGVSSDLISDHKGIVDFDKEATEKFTQVYLDTGQYPDTIIADDGKEYTFGEYMQYLHVKSLEEERDAWYRAMYDNGWNFYDFVHKNEKNILPTLTTSTYGYGARIDVYDIANDRIYSSMLCDYVQLYPAGTNSIYTNFRAKSNDGSTVFPYASRGSGHMKDDGSINYSASAASVFQNYTYVPGYGYLSLDGKYLYRLYGDVRNIDETQAPTDDEYNYEVGETPDGTRVTVDMLNPDGTVDGQPVTPDLTQFDKNALLDLIRDMLEASKNTYETTDPDNVVNPDDVTVPDISEELGDFTVPIGITTVFPFCLPFDFVRGMKLFSAKPVTPHFEVTVDVPAVLNVPAQEWTLEIDLGKFEALAKITRWTSLVSFSYLLIILSTKIVKGAGA